MSRHFRWNSDKMRMRRMKRGRPQGDFVHISTSPPLFWSFSLGRLRSAAKYLARMRRVRGEERAGFLSLFNWFRFQHLLPGRWWEKGFGGRGGEDETPRIAEARRKEERGRGLLCGRGEFKLAQVHQRKSNISQVQEHRHSGGSDRYSVLGEPEPRLPVAEDKLALRLEEQYLRKPAEQQYLIDVTASVPVAVPLLTHPDLLRYLGPCGVSQNQLNVSD